MKKILVLMLVLAFAAPAFPQEVTGAITGRAQDTSGALIPGVEVSITSPAMIGGARAAVTDEQGVYRFTLLPAGTYRVTFSLSGFKTLNIDGVDVTPGKTMSINASMQVASVAEEVTVISDAPQIDLQAATVGVNWGDQTLDKLPYGRDIRGLAQMIPGLYTPNYDVGGNTLGGSTTTGARVYGRSGGELLSFEGVVWDQFFGDYLTYQEVNFSTAAKGAEAQSPGTAISFVIKSGGNDFHGSAYTNYQSGRFQSDNVTQKLLDMGYIRGRNKFTKLYEVNGEVGGPILKDKLWFYSAFSYQYSGLFLPGFISEKTNEQVEFFTSLHNPTVKLSYQLNDKMKFEMVEQLNRKWQPYRNGSSLVTKEASQNQLAWTAIGPSLKWIYIVNPKMTVDASVNRSGYWWPDYAWTKDPRKTDITTSSNRGEYLQVYRRPIRWGWNSTWSYFTPIAGKNNEIKSGINGYWNKSYTDQFGYPDSYQQVYRYRSRTGDANLFTRPDSVQVLDYPNFVASGVNYESWFINDKLTLNRKLTLNAGVRLDHYSSWLPEQGNPGTGPWAVKNTIPEKRDFPKYSNWSPRISVVYDVKGDGRLALKASYGKYVGAGSSVSASSGPIAGDVNTNVIRTCTYNNWNGVIPFTPNKGPDGVLGTADDPNIAGACSGGGGIQRLDPGLRAGRTDEYTAGIELGLKGNYLVRFNAVRKMDYGGSKTLDLAQPYEAYTGVRSQVDPGRDNVTGTADDRPILVYSVPRNYPTFGQVNTLRTNYAQNERNRLYTAYETTINKRYSAGWSFLAGYTAAFAKTSFPIPQNPNQALYRAAVGQGSQNDWQAPFWSYSLKMSATYDMPWGLLWAGTYNAQSGEPFGRTIQVQNALNSTVNIQIESIAGRYPWVKLFDNRISKVFKIGDRQSIEGQLDLFNTLNSSAILTWGTTNGPNYHKPLSTGGIDASAASPIIAPRVVRFAVRYRF